MRRIIFCFLFLGMVSTIGFLSSGEASAEGIKAYFVDILYLKKGKTPADAMVYFENVVPVIAEHGLKRITPAFVVTKKMSGNIDPHLINIWSVSNPKSTFSDIFSDKAYLKHVPLRDAIFDMKRSHMFMLKAAK